MNWAGTAFNGIPADLLTPKPVKPDYAAFLGRMAPEKGVERATTQLDDVAYKAYDHVKDYEQRAREYLAWEVALVEQIKRDPTIRFRTF